MMEEHENEAIPAIFIDKPAVNVRPKCLWTGCPGHDRNICCTACGLDPDRPTTISGAIGTSNHPTGNRDPHAYSNCVPNWGTHRDCHLYSHTYCSAAGYSDGSLRSGNDLDTLDTDSSDTAGH